MPANSTKAPTSIGFFTVCEHLEQGLFGGYLVLNLSGRPLEFHCTAPVRPNRAQQILYGPTLRPYLYGEQIGRALLARASAVPLLVFTDQQQALCLRQATPVPVVYVEGELSEPGAIDGRWHRADPAHAEPAPARLPRLHRFTLGQQQLAVAEANRDDEQEVVRQWQPHAEGFDLAEPFGRIREAIEEARRTAR